MMKLPLSTLSLTVITTLLLASCGGSGSSSETEQATTTPSTPTPTITPSITPTIAVKSLEVAQNHVIPNTGKKWKNGDGSVKASLTLAAKRSALALVEFQSNLPVATDQPMIEGWLGDTKLGSVPLKLPSDLPATESDGVAYSTTTYSATLPAAWIQPNLTLKVSAKNYQSSDVLPVNVGAESEHTLWVMPVYYFGANDANTVPYAEISQPTAREKDEIFNKLPFSKLTISPYKTGRISWPYLVIGPRNGQLAYIMKNKDEQKDGFATIASTMNIAGAIRRANGESNLNSSMYMPMMMVHADGKSIARPYGGLGGGSLAAGSPSFNGIFMHEVGHSLGMPHAAESYEAGYFPYEKGSHKGSAWGFDSANNQFLSPLIPTQASSYANCVKDGRATNSQGQCYKQDIMQGGGDDRNALHRYGSFTDFHAATAQRYFEGVTTQNDDGSYDYSGGRIMEDGDFATGYSRWNGVLKKRVAFDPKNHTTKGLWGLNAGYPIQKNVPVHTIVMTVSIAGT